MIHFDRPFLTIHWDDTVHCVWMEWKEFVAGQGFREGLNKGLALIEKKKTHRWLADLRKLGVVGPEDQKWSNEDWFPRALAGGVTRMAIVVPESTLAQMSVDAIMSKVDDVGLVVHYFDGLEDARAWLKAK